MKFNLYLQMMLVISFIILFCIYNISVNGLGCIVTLTRGFPEKDNSDKYKAWYESTLIKRNKAIEKYLYSTRSELIDIIIFQEGDISKIHQNYIQNATPKLKLLFVNVKDSFRKIKYTTNPICPPSKISDNTRYGYKAMCQFWFAYFSKYTKQYDWLLRIDSDNILLANIANTLKSFHGKANIASSVWRDGKNRSPDQITARSEGSVVLGMRDLTKNFATSHNISGQFNNWKMPYTNIFYLNLQWYRNSSIIRDYTNTVLQSKCIFSNRWGDMPLWGAIAAITNQPSYVINIPYYHGSHHKKIKPIARI